MALNNLGLGSSKIMVGLTKNKTFSLKIKDGRRKDTHFVIRLLTIF